MSIMNFAFSLCIRNSIECFHFDFHNHSNDDGDNDDEQGK